MIFDIRLACLMCRLSRLVDGKSEELEVERCDEDKDGFFRADFRGLGAFWIGA